MKNLKSNYSKSAVFLLLGVSLAISSCKKDRLPTIDPVPSETAGVYVLCEGAYGELNNSTITYYDVATRAVDPDYFKTKNGISLGSNANDLKQYGSKLYCVVTGTTPDKNDSYVEVISLATGKSIKRIPFSDGSSGYLPRYIAFYKNKAYVSGYDGYINKIDTASLNIDGRIKVGGALEGVAITNGKLYVTNTAHSIYVSPINTSVSVVDLGSFTKVDEITVSYNPTKIAVGANGTLFSIAKGKYLSTTLLPALDQISSVTDKKVQSFNYNLATITISGNKGFAIGDYPDYFLKRLNTSTGALGENFIIDGTAITSFYGVTVNELNSDVYVADANNYAETGKVVCFNATGVKQFDFATGAIPQSAAFKYIYK